MVILILIVFGLCLGSFVNALVWRVHEQSIVRKKSRKAPKYTKEQLSISKGRSMCVQCGHTLSSTDLVPVLSWMFLRGKCRYCRKPISWQYPLVELLTAALFVVSYIWWPMEWTTAGAVNFVGWLLALVVLMALLVYDVRWMLLPNRMVYPLIAGSALLFMTNVVAFDGGVYLVWYGLLSAAISGGLFYGLFVISDGRWIGGGDVKLGFALGLLLMDPYKAFLMLFTASLLGIIAALPGMFAKKITFASKMPFGPFLIIATVIIRLFGGSIIAWYKNKIYSGI